MGEKKAALNKAANEASKPTRVISLKDKLTVSDYERSPLNAAWKANGSSVSVCADTAVQPDCRFFRIGSIRRLNREVLREKMETVISSVRDIGYNYVFVLTAGLSGVTIDLGVVRNTHRQGCGEAANAWEYGDVLRGAFQGCLKGSVLEVETDNIIEKTGSYKRFAVMTGVPFVQDKNDHQERTINGLDVMIHSCSDLTWRMIVCASPATAEEIRANYDALCQMYSELSEKSRNTIQKGDSIQNSKSHSDTQGDTHTDSHGDTKGTNEGESHNNSSKSTTTGSHKDHNDSHSDSHQESSADTESSGDSTVQNVSYEKISKTNMELMKYMDDVLLARLRSGMSKGMFRTDIYLMADSKDDLNRVQSVFCSAFGGNLNELNPPHPMPLGFIKDNELKRIAQSFQTDSIRIQCDGASQLIFGHSCTEHNCASSTLLTAAELSAIAGVPEQDVLGIPFRARAEFGLNALENTDGIELGTLICSGVNNPEKKIRLPKNILNRHVLVAGVTGSGKTTTCQTLLLRSNLPFLVIEPAKTEYRALLSAGMDNNLQIFTLGSEASPFRMNPFELVQGENFTAHVDMLTASFTSAFPMEAAMPQILEESIYKCYENYGWNSSTGTNKYTNDPFTEDGRYFPILQDLLPIIEEVVKSKGFGTLMQGDYIGSLTGRLSGLLTGSKGCMLNCRKSIEFSKLLDECTVLELEELRSGNDKAFVMGLVMARLSECLRHRHETDINFRHITLIEEAHRLLTKTLPSDNGAKRAAVECFTDLLAEVRKYGESLIIADQIPNKLAADVLKNTNTKIIHKLFAADDKAAVGDTMMMDDTQRDYLSTLAQGEVVLFTEATPKPVNLMVTGITDTSAEVSPAEIEKAFKRTSEKNDRIIADGCLFTNLTAQQRYSIDRYGPRMDEFSKQMDALLKTMPNSFTEKSKNASVFSETARAMHNMMAEAEQAAKIPAQSLWNELVWRYMLSRGKHRGQYIKLEEVYNKLSSVYGSFIEEPDKALSGEGMTEEYIQGLKSL